MQIEKNRRTNSYAKLQEDVSHIMERNNKRNYYAAGGTTKNREKIKQNRKRVMNRSVHHP